MTITATEKSHRGLASFISITWLLKPHEFRRYISVETKNYSVKMFVPYCFISILFCTSIILHRFYFVCSKSYFVWWQLADRELYCREHRVNMTSLNHSLFGVRQDNIAYAPTFAAHADKNNSLLSNPEGTNSNDTESFPRNSAAVFSAITNEPTSHG